MNTKQLTQILPVVEQIYGWGDVCTMDIAVTSETCGQVDAFTLTRQESEGGGSGLLLTVTRVAGEDLWCLQPDQGGPCTLIYAI